MKYFDRRLDTEEDEDELSEETNLSFGKLIYVFTSGGPYSSYEDRGDGHDQAAEGGEEGKGLGVGS